jgi:hypothetical protein
VGAPRVPLARGSIPLDPARPWLVAEWCDGRLRVLYAFPERKYADACADHLRRRQGFRAVVLEMTGGP